MDFLESTPGSYLRIAPSNSLQGRTFSYSDVSAAVAVLLGTTPPSSISDESVSKLNDLLVPNPFHRPHAVLMLTLEQIKQGGKISVAAVQHRELELESKKATLTLPEDVTPLLLNMNLGEESKSADVDGKLQELASFLGGSYESGREPSKGMLQLHFPSGVVSLDLAKKVSQALAFELLSIFQQMKDAVSVLDKVPGGLVFSTLTATETLYKEPEGSMTSEQASELLGLVVTKVFTYLDSAFNGGLVGVIVNAQEQILDLKFTRGPSRLQFLQTSSDTITSVAAEVLTETIIAYITGILFIIALIIGTCFLFKMPLTRDTLLYSSAKLD